MEIGQDDRKVPQRIGRRIVGQVAGNEIHHEIEDVLDKKKLSSEKLGGQKFTNSLIG